MSIIDNFLEFTEGQPTSRHFRLWAGIALCSVLQERRTFCFLTGKAVYGNMYVLLVANPGIGKSNVISDVENLILESKIDIAIAPASVTYQKLVDEMKAKEKSMMLKINNVPHEMRVSPMACLNSEYGNFVTENNLEYLNFLNHAYDCPMKYTRATKGGGSIVVNNPSLAMLSGTQPSFLAETFPESAWSMGITSRTIMIHASSGNVPNLFGSKTIPLDFKQSLLEEIREKNKLSGQFTVTLDAQIFIQDWLNKGLIPKPVHPKLASYESRRLINFMKLCMALSFSDRNDLVIDLPIMLKAKDILLEAEARMPLVFSDMRLGGSMSVIDEIHSSLKSKAQATKNSVVKESDVFTEIAIRAKPNEHMHIFDLMLKQKKIEKIGVLSPSSVVQEGDDIRRVSYGIGEQLFKVHL